MTKTVKARQVRDRFIDYEDKAQLLRALADPYRLQILEFCLVVPQHQVDIIDWLGEVNPRRLTQPTVSHHVRVLRVAGLITANKQGRTTIYSAMPDRVAQACDILAGLLPVDTEVIDE